MEEKIISQRITTNLWFDKQAEEAVQFYTTVFKKSKIGNVTHYVEEGFAHHQKPTGSVMTIEFSLDGQEFIALNGGPMFKFNEAISLIVNCKDQNEVDYYWEHLGDGGDEKAQVCGWLKDKFGVSWQVVPVVLNEMILDSDVAKVNRVLKAMFKMKKIDIATLEKAYQR